MIKLIRKIVFKWACWMDKREWCKILYAEARFYNIKGWKVFIYKLCVKIIHLINKVDPKGSWYPGYREDMKGIRRIISQEPVREFIVEVEE